MPAQLNGHKHSAINVVLAFNMGTNVENIMNSPIGQPMAVVSA